MVFSLLNYKDDARSHKRKIHKIYLFLSTAETHTCNKTVYTDIATYKIPWQVRRKTGVREMLHI